MPQQLFLVSLKVGRSHWCDMALFGMTAAQWRDANPKEVTDPAVCRQLLDDLRQFVSASQGSEWVRT